MRISSFFRPLVEAGALVAGALCRGGVENPIAKVAVGTGCALYGGFNLFQALFPKAIAGHDLKVSSKDRCIRGTVGICYAVAGAIYAIDGVREHLWPSQVPSISILPSQDLSKELAEAQDLASEILRCKEAKRKVLSVFGPVSGFNIEWTDGSGPACKWDRMTRTVIMNPSGNLTAKVSSYVAMVCKQSAKDSVVEEVAPYQQYFHDWMISLRKSFFCQYDVYSKCVASGEWPNTTSIPYDWAFSGDNAPWKTYHSFAQDLTKNDTIAKVHGMVWRDWITQVASQYCPEHAGDLDCVAATAHFVANNITTS